MRVDRRATGYSPADFGIGRLFEHVRDAIIVANAATERIVVWNPWATQVFGYSHSEALEMPLHTLVPESLRSRHRAGLANYQDTGTGALLADSTTAVQLVGLHKDGHEVPIELSLTAIPDRTPEGDRFVLAIVRDVSERIAAEVARARLRDAELLRRQALQLNDDVVQGLVVAKMSLETDDRPGAELALERTLTAAQSIVSGLLATLRGGAALEPGDLIRQTYEDDIATSPE